jgi:hypothetical protein
VKQNKAIGYEGVAEIIHCLDISARVLLVQDVPEFLTAGDLVMVEFCSGRITAVLKNAVPVKTTWYKRFASFFNLQ